MPPKGETEEDKNKLSPKHKLSDDEVNDKISGIVTANLFNFLGTGLKEARNFSINEKIKLINFENAK